VVCLCCLSIVASADINLGYFHGRRRSPEDAWTVSHIPFLVAKYDCHINIEYSGTVALFQYLFKYFYKGPDTVSYALVPSSEIQTNTDSALDVQASSSSVSRDGLKKRRPVDQSKDYIRARYLSSIEAATRIASFHITYKHPGVSRLPIHLPGRQFSQMTRKNQEQSNATLLMRYLDRPSHPRLDNMTYIEFGEHCHMTTHDASKPIHALEIVEDIVPDRPQMRIRFYADKHIGVSRIAMVYPYHGDVFYLRALLVHRSAHSWTDLRTVEGVEHATFQEAARAFGLFTNNDEAILAFEELLQMGASPAQLRWLFAVLGAEGEPVLLLWEKYEDNLSADVRDTLLQTNPHPAALIVRNLTLIRLQELLQGLGRSLLDLGLPVPDTLQRELDAERLRWNGDPHDLHRFCDSLTNDQVSHYGFALPRVTDYSL